MDDLTNKQAWIAFRYGGADLAPEHGGLALLLIPHLYFWKSAKWVRGSITLLDHDEPGFWERYGYNNYGDPWREQRSRCRFLRTSTVGDHVEVRGTIGGWFVWHLDQTQPIQLVAGGFGIAPPMAMIRSREARAAQHGSDCCIPCAIRRACATSIHPPDLARSIEAR